MERSDDADLSTRFNKGLSLRTPAPGWPSFLAEAIRWSTGVVTVIKGRHFTDECSKEAEPWWCHNYGTQSYLISPACRCSHATGAHTASSVCVWGGGSRPGSLLQVRENLFPFLEVSIMCPDKFTQFLLVQVLLDLERQIKIGKGIRYWWHFPDTTPFLASIFLLLAPVFLFFPFPAPFPVFMNPVFPISPIHGGGVLHSPMPINVSQLVPS